MKDVTAPYPSMPNATLLLFANVSISYSYCPVDIIFSQVAIHMSHLSFLNSSWRLWVGIQNAVEKKNRLPNVIRRQTNGPDSMIFKNFSLGFVIISHRRTINPRELRNPIIRNRHWKCSGSSMLGL